LACRSDDAGFFSCLSEVIEPRRLEVDSGDSVLIAVLCADLKLARYGLLFAHGMIKTRLSILTESRDYQQVCSGCREYPLAISADLNRYNRITQTRQQGFGVLVHLLVQSYLSVCTSNCQTAIETSVDALELHICFIFLELSNTALAIKSGVNGEHRPVTDALKTLAGGVLRIFEFVCQLQHLLSLAKPKLINDFASV